MAADPPLPRQDECPYENGYIPQSVMIEVEPGLWAEIATGGSYLAAKSRAAEEGRWIGVAAPAGANRDWGTQYDMKFGIPSYEYWNLNPASGAALADPGDSTHGLGTSLDIIGDLGWFLEHAEEYGFRRLIWNDPNHFTYLYPTWTQAPTATIDTEDDMTWRVVQKPNGDYYGVLITERTLKVYPTDTPAELEVYYSAARLYGPPPGTKPETYTIAESDLKLALLDVDWRRDQLPTVVNVNQDDYIGTATKQGDGRFLVDLKAVR